MTDLTIVIPTYNRSTWIHGLLSSLKGLLSSTSLTCEIVISDNHSDPSVESALTMEPAVNIPYRIVKPERHLEKAEENLFFSIGFCNGKFVWALGDDDPPNREGFTRLTELIHANEHDMMLFDSNRYLADCELINGTIDYTDTSGIRTIQDYIKIGGFWYTLAGFSNVVFRRPDDTMLDAAQELLTINPIYSHVFWFTMFFWDRPFRFEPVPLVTYSENRRDEFDHWEKNASKDGVFKTFYWTLGFARQVRYIRGFVRMPAGWLSDVWEVEWNLRRAPLLDNICFIAWHEIIDEHKIARSMTRDEMMEICDFLVEENPRFGIFASFLRSNDFDIGRMRDNRGIIEGFINNSRSHPLFDYYIGAYRGFSLYKLHGRYLALFRSEAGELAKHIEDIALGNDELSFSSTDMDKLKEHINNHYSEIIRSAQQNRHSRDQRSLLKSISNLERLLREILIDLRKSPSIPGPGERVPFASRIKGIIRRSARILLPGKFIIPLRNIRKNLRQS